MKKIKTGDTIKLKKEHKKILKSKFDDITNLRTEITAIMNIIGNKRKDLWEFVYKIYPELTGYDLSFDYEAGVINVEKEPK